MSYTPAEHIVDANKMVPAAMPSEEDGARTIYESNPRNKRWDLLADKVKERYREQARAVLALFAPILAEKEREIERLTARTKLPVIADYIEVQDHSRAMEARALAAEAAVLAVAPYVDSIVCYTSTVDEHDGNRVAKLVNDAAAAIRAQGE